MRWWVQHILNTAGLTCIQFCTQLGLSPQGVRTWYTSDKRADLHIIASILPLQYRACLCHVPFCIQYLIGMLSDKKKNLFDLLSSDRTSHWHLELHIWFITQTRSRCCTQHIVTFTRSQWDANLPPFHTAPAAGHSTGPAAILQWRIIPVR